MYECIIASFKKHTTIDEHGIFIYLNVIKIHTVLFVYVRYEKDSSIFQNKCIENAWFIVYSIRLT